MHKMLSFQQTHQFSDFKQSFNNPVEISCFFAFSSLFIVSKKIILTNYVYKKLIPSFPHRVKYLFVVGQRANVAVRQQAW